MLAYAITDPRTLNFKRLTQDLNHFSTYADMIVYRDKNNKNYPAYASRFIKEARKHSFQKVLLHTDYLLAHKLEADGIHLKSTQFSEIQKAKDLGLFTVISTHTLKEVLEAEKLGADVVTYSPIFSTPNKGKPKGLEELQSVVSSVSIPIIALGGIVTEKQIRGCEEYGAHGFASIRYFLRDKI